MQGVLTELTPECELTTQMYISGLEKEEIAEIKCRASSTIITRCKKLFRFLMSKMEGSYVVGSMKGFQELNLLLIFPLLYVHLRLGYLLVYFPFLFFMSKAT